MPRKSQKSSGRYELRKKNNISLRDDEPLDETLKVLKIGDVNTPIQIASNDIRLASSLQIDSEALFLDTILINSKIKSLDNFLILEPTGSGNIMFEHEDNTIFRFSCGTDTLFLPSSGVISFGDDGDQLGTIKGDDLRIVDNDFTMSKITNLASTSSFQVFGANIDGSSDTGYCTIIVGANGETNINTSDTDGAVGHLTLVPDGDLILDPVSQKTIINATDHLYFDGGSHTYIVESSDDILDFYVGADKMLSLDEANDKIIIGATNWVAGTVSGGTVTEFSATNSAYAGMILGYTRIQDNSTNPGTDYITINSSTMTVLQTAAGTDLSIQFIVPPSGNVEIDCKFFVQAISDGARFSLSTGSSYAELGETHTYDADSTFFIDESDHYVVSVVFAVTGLTAGTDTTYYLAGFATGASTFIRHGRFRTTGLHSPPIILKATALPATIVTGE
tara:strand:- start:47 stop:1393 length:1347 start_codon:yes stop_codon:yes gene_type:complete